MNFMNFLIQMRRLMNLKRYQNFFLFKQRSVAEHSWSVSMIAHSLAMIEKYKFGKEVDLASLLQKAIMHDSLESFTGDILSNIKRRTPSMMRAVASLEKQVFNEEYADIIPDPVLLETYRHFTLDAKSDDLEGQLLQAADIIDTLFESLEEIRLGNLDYFSVVMQTSLEKLMELNVDSAQYFLKDFLTTLQEDQFDFEGCFGPVFHQKITRYIAKENPLAI